MEEHTEPLLQDMPHEVLVRIMQAVPLQHRLHTCALVSTAWAKAATAATTSICDSQLSSNHRVSDILAWVSKHGQHVSSLALEPSIRVAGRKLLELLQPLPNLRSMDLKGMSMRLAPGGFLQWVNVQLGPGRGYGGLLAAVPNITKLALRVVMVQADMQCLTVLTALKALQDLELYADIPMAVAGMSPIPLAEFLARMSATRAPEWNLPLDMWAGLTKLTRLGLLDQYNLTDADVAALSSITGLQHLSLDARFLTATVLEPLQHLQQLSVLHFRAAALSAALQAGP